MLKRHIQKSRYYSCGSRILVREVKTYTNRHVSFAVWKFGARLSRTTTRHSRARGDEQILAKISRYQRGFQDFSRDFKISTEISRRFPDFSQISRFQEKFRISSGFPGFHQDSGGISKEVYEISRSDRPLVADRVRILLMLTYSFHHS